MHTEAFWWVRDHAPAGAVSVLDIGGRYVNGSVRQLFPAAATYTSLDIADGPGVDVVADAATWVPDRSYDVVVCCEVFEHTADWPAICKTAYLATASGGLLIVTTATGGRAPHSAADGGPLRPGEYYANVDPAELADALDVAGWQQVVVDVLSRPGDVRATAARG